MGKIDIAHLHQESISMDELEEAIREHGIDSYKNVKLAILEVDGNISVLRLRIKSAMTADEVTQ
jgi:uncharacterized membrane protein YcaP (DUF421 family)